MARDQIDMTPIETRDELVAWLAAGAKPKAEFRMGTEHEKLVFTRAGNVPVPYAGPRGIRALLEGMRDLLGWEPIMEGGNIIGLTSRHRRRGDFARARRAVRVVRRAGRDGPRERGGDQCASGADRRGCPAAGARVPQPRHDAEMEPRRNAGDAQGALPHHDRLHAEGRHARPRHDVSDLHGTDQSRLLLGSRHGHEAASGFGSAADRDGTVRQLAVHRRQAERLSIVPLRDLARHR